MYTERYLPKKYRDSRKRRRRNHIRLVILISVVAAAVIIGGYFLIHWLTGRSSNGDVVIPTPSPTSVSGITPTGSATVFPSSTPADNGAADTPVPEVTFGASASPAAT